MDLKINKSWMFISLFIIIVIVIYIFLSKKLESFVYFSMLEKQDAIMENY